MKRYDVVPHTADTMLEVEASSLEELFSAALLGMSSIIKRDLCQEEESHPLRETVSIESLDRSSLLVDFLSEVLALTHENKAVFCKARFISLEESSLQAEIWGAPGDGFDEDIKAVTYHGALIGTNDRGNLEVKVLFDI